MGIVKILTEPAVLIITAFFMFFIINVAKNYTAVEKNLHTVYAYLKALNKKEISYRFSQMDEFMSANHFINTPWEDFKKALIFPEKLYVVSQNAKAGGEFKPDVYLTVDAGYFFNEETLVHSQINHKFIQIMPTLLTGLGPFFTFLKMAIAFSAVSFSLDAEVAGSLDGLIDNIQIAALCSVFAVGFSLLFMFLEKVLYNKMCKTNYIAIQREFIRLFDVVTSENFLIDLLKESKIQSVTTAKMLKTLPDEFAKAISKTLSETTTPYLENILYSLNTLNNSMQKKSGSDVVDKLF